MAFNCQPLVVCDIFITTPGQDHRYFLQEASHEASLLANHKFRLSTAIAGCLCCWPTLYVHSTYRSKQSGDQYSGGDEQPGCHIERGNSGAGVS
jgi:hypothetical protein